MSLRKVFAVARHEFIGTVTRLGYVLTLVGMPLFIGGLGGLSGLATSKVVLEQLTREKKIGVVDDSGLFGGAPQRASSPLKRTKKNLPSVMRAVEIPEPPGAQIVRFDTLEAARRGLLDARIDGILHIPRDFLEKGQLAEYRRARKSLSMTPQLEGPARLLRPWLIEALLQGRIEPAIAARIAATPEVETFVVDPDGHTEPEDLLREIKPFVVPLGFTLFLLLSIFTSASYLATGLAEDKQNRALEMLLTSVSPEQLFWGKLLGLWAAAFLQFALYLALVALPAALAFAALDIHLGQVLFGLSYFVLGFFFFGAVLLAVGAIGNSHKYTQQISGLFTFTAIVPMLTLPALLSDPAGGLARTLTFIPFTAPLTGMLRAGAGALPLWEFFASLVVLALSAWLAIGASAKIFRVALLSTGTTPGLRQIVAWLRE